jgi:hypothetical protein
MWAPAENLVISAEDRRLLETWPRAHNAPQSVAIFAARQEWTTFTRDE